MNIWENAVITEKGLALQAKLMAGHSLTITRAATGSGFVTPGLLFQQKAVTEEKQAMDLRPISYPEDGKCTLTVALRNDDLAVGYTALQLGIYAMDPDEGEILDFIAQSPDKDHGTPVPGKDEMAYSGEWEFTFQYGQADGVSVVIDPSGAVSREEMEQYIGDEFNAMTADEIDSAFA